jgi:phosphoribosylamine-glycine ligase
MLFDEICLQFYPDHDYRGALSIRLFLTSSGPKVVEYRLGFQALLCETFLPLLDADLAQLFLACTTRTLHSVPFRFHDLKACNVVMVTDDYPNNTQTNIELSFKQGPKNTFIFHEDTKWDAEGGLVRGVGGRIYSSVGIGPQMSVARRKALEGMKAAKFDRMVYRKDIGAVERS